MQGNEMENDIMADERQLKRSEEEIDAEFDQHNVDVEEILARTQRSFTSHRRRRVQDLYEAPEFVKRLNAFEEAQVGDTVIFQCQWRAFPKPTIKWYKDDEEITEDARYNIEPDDNLNGLIRLVVNGAKKCDEGAYKCKAENQEGVASTTGYLSVAGSANDATKTLAAKKKEQKQQEKQQKQEEQNQAEEVSEEGDPQGGRKAQPDRNVSYPPHLRTIIEQKSLEEREAESSRDQPPSPIQEFIEKMQSGRGKGATWPYAVLGYQVGDFAKDNDEEKGSDTDTSVDSQDFERVSFSVQTDDDDVFTSSDSDITPSNQQKLLQQQQQQQQQHNVLPASNQISILANSQKNNCVPRVNVCSTTRPIVCTNMTQRVPEVIVNGSSGPVLLAGTSTPQLRQTKPGEVTIRSQPLDFGHMLDLLDSPWLYFLPINSSMTFVASATEMSPLLVVLIMAILSCIAFRFLFSDDR